MELPFDKLPKFLAVAGIALISGGASLAYSGYVARSHEMAKLIEIDAPFKARDEIRSQSKLLDVADKPLSADCRQPSSIPSQQETAQTCRHKIDVKPADEELNRQKDKEAIEDQRAEREAIEAFWDKYYEESKLYRLQMILGSLGVLVGAGVAGYGFKGWRDLEKMPQSSSKRK